MSRAVWKFPLPPKPGVHALKMPRGARIVSFAEQRGVPVLWAVVDPERAPRLRMIRLAMTGDRVDEGHADAPCLGTVQIEDGMFVLHAFDLGEGPPS